MIQTIFLGLWITIFCLVCVAVRRAVRERSRQCRHAQRQEIRRFTGDYSSHRRSRRHRTAYAMAS